MFMNYKKLMAFFKHGLLPLFPNDQKPNHHYNYLGGNNEVHKDHQDKRHWKTVHSNALAMNENDSSILYIHHEFAGNKTQAIFLKAVNEIMDVVLKICVSQNSQICCLIACRFLGC